MNCPHCDGKGVVDSGGFSPGGQGIDIPCPMCAKSQWCKTCAGMGRIYGLACSVPCPDCAKKDATGQPPATTLQYHIDCQVFSDEKIDLTLRKAQEELARWVIDTREDAIRESLIKLGWKPPGYKPMITVGWPTIAILAHGKEVHLQEAILIPDSELHNTANRIACGELGGQPEGSTPK